jgi:hypothetical protein
MARESHRTLEVLEEISANRDVTQRSLSHRLDISLGMANLYLRRLAKKGDIKITTVPGKRLLRYMLTPQGFATKSKLTYEFATYSYRYLRGAREHMRQELEQLKQEGRERVVLCGQGELAEIAYLAMLEGGLKLAGVVAGSGGVKAGSHQTFLGHQVVPCESLKALEFDAVVAFSNEDGQAIAPFVTNQRMVLLAPEATTAS